MNTGSAWLYYTDAKNKGVINEYWPGFYILNEYRAPSRSRNECRIEFRNLVDISLSFHFCRPLYLGSSV